MFRVIERPGIGYTFSGGDHEIIGLEGEVVAVVNAEGNPTLAQGIADFLTACASTDAGSHSRTLARLMVGACATFPPQPDFPHQSAARQ